MSRFYEKSTILAHIDCLQLTVQIDVQVVLRWSVPSSAAPQWSLVDDDACIAHGYPLTVPGFACWCAFVSCKTQNPIQIIKPTNICEQSYLTHHTCTSATVADLTPHTGWRKVLLRLRSKPRWRKYSGLVFCKTSEEILEWQCRMLRQWKLQKSSLWRRFYTAGKCHTGPGIALLGVVGVSVWGLVLLVVDFSCVG